MTKKPETKTEIVAAAPTLPAVQETPVSHGEQVLNSDIVIPKVLLCQGLSEAVAERKAQQGDIIRSTNFEKLGDNTKPVEIIPITMKNEWTLQEKVGGKFEYRGVEPRTAQNEDLPWDFIKNGAEWRRMKVINLFALLPADVAAEASEIKKFHETGEVPDLNKTLMPVVVSFRSTSFNAGKSVATHFAKAHSQAKYGVKPYGYTLQLECFLDKNDKGSYYVYTVGAGRKCNADELAKAGEWAQVLSTQKVQVDDSDERVVESTPAQSGPARF